MTLNLALTFCGRLAIAYISTKILTEHKSGNRNSLNLTDTFPNMDTPGCIYGKIMNVVLAINQVNDGRKQRIFRVRILTVNSSDLSSSLDKHRGNMSLRDISDLLSN